MKKSLWNRTLAEREVLQLAFIESANFENRPTKAKIGLEWATRRLAGLFDCAQGRLARAPVPTQLSLHDSVITQRRLDQLLRKRYGVTPSARDSDGRFVVLPGREES